MKNKEKIYTITSIILILDQGIKLLVNHYMKLYQQISIIPNFFSLFYVRNKGAAFSILENNTILLIIISIISILILNWYIKETNYTKLSILSLGMILGGIFGNLVDRILYHSVIDYLSFIIFHYSFPIFNLADIAITTGIVLLGVDMIFTKKGD